MEYIAFNEFSFLTLLAGGIFLITGLIYRFNPPKATTWYGGMQLEAARRSEETFQEAIRFAVKPLLFTGLALLLVGLLSIFFLKSGFFTLVLACIQIMIICMVLVSLIKQHINALFDDKGNRKEIITRWSK